MKYLQLEIKGSVAILWLDEPDSKVNRLSVTLLEEFQRLLDRLESDSTIQAAVLASRKPDNWIAGADIEALASMKAGEAARLSREASRLLQRLSDSSKPFVAAIHGGALGGGLEVAMACRYRIVSDAPSTVLGLPEVKLGLLPAAGGTQRLPRMVGLVRSLDMLLTGKNVYPYPARKMGLVDHVTYPSGLVGTAVRAAQELARGQLRHGRRPKSWTDWVVEENRLGRAMVFRRAARKVSAQTRGNYPAPWRILDCVRTGLNQGMDAGLEKEATCFEELLHSPQSRHLVQLFFASNRARKNPLAARTRPVKTIAIVGAGLMGTGIAEVSARNGVRVVLKDLDHKRLGESRKVIWNHLQSRVKKRALSSFERDQITSRIATSLDYRDLRGASLVIEAVFERLDLKRAILADVEASTPSDTIFASNTSSLPIRDIAESAARPQQVIGMHYFSPVQKMPLLEIITTPETDPWVRASAIDVGLRQGKTIIAVKDSPGFYTTRILSPLMYEAVLLVQEGAPIDALDRAMMDCGFPIGPLALMDEVGIDVAAHVSEILRPLFMQRGIDHGFQNRRLVEAGLEGRKNGKGFYLYGSGAKEPNPAIYPLLEATPRPSLDRESAQQRLLLAMVNEAILCLQEEVLSTPGDGDVGAVLGLGFPPFLGGPFRYADSLGDGVASRRLERLQEVHGVRFRPAQLLQDMAARRQRFHP